jgi:hypothetical protein
MNQRTYALLLSMSDTTTRPLWTSMPGNEPGYWFAGSPVHIITQMPDVGPGSTPIAYGDWKKVYMIVWRKAVTMMVDPCSAGWCTLYKFEARVGRPAASQRCPLAHDSLRAAVARARSLLDLVRKVRASTAPRLYPDRRRPKGTIRILGVLYLLQDAELPPAHSCS